MDISDESIVDAYRADPKAAGAAVQAQRLRVDTRKWLMAKMKPKVYGEKLDLTSDGKVLPAPIYGGQSTKEV
jgi:outer membrane lipoprotein-sorting protein